MDPSHRLPPGAIQKDDAERFQRDTIEKIKYHMNHIADCFNSPLVTLVVRNPDVDQGRGEGDFVLTTDEIGHVIKALEYRQHAAILTAMYQQGQLK